MRKHYIDNLRWITILILIPYHAAMAWNVWGEPNYIFFEGNRAISSIVVFFSPYFMPLLFILAGISTRFALQKRTVKEYMLERTKRLLIPFLFGTAALMPIMSYIADKFNYSYNEGFFRHYAVFFTRYTDLTGADGGFSLGQFWFLLYLLVISTVSAALLSLFKKIPKNTKKHSVPAGCYSGTAIASAQRIALGQRKKLRGIYISLSGRLFCIFKRQNNNNRREKLPDIVCRWSVGVYSRRIPFYLVEQGICFA